MKKVFNDYIKILSIFGMIIISIIIYYIFYISKFYDKISNDILLNKFNLLIYDYWAISHIILFFIVTYLFPNRYIFITICGIVWELIEHSIRYILNYLYITNQLNNYYHSKLDKYVKKKQKKFNKQENWWYGRYEDILYNAIGTILALIVKNIKY
tara:strand:+ start:427 stop:891 length:465 start_codon:yes stop_codon:yes gene_type:complete